MQLPFTHDQFLAVFADYNRALWPVLVLGLGRNGVRPVARRLPDPARS